MLTSKNTKYHIPHHGMTLTLTEYHIPHHGRIHGESVLKLTPEINALLL